MNVHELVTKLQTLNAENEVVVGDDGGDGATYPVSGIGENNDDVVIEYDESDPR